MANMKYFHGDHQLGAVTSMPNAEFAKRFPGVVGRRYDGYHMWGWISRRRTRSGAASRAGDRVQNEPEAT